MLSAFQTFGRLGAGARAVAAAWTPAALWPTGTEAGMWIDPSNLTSQWQDSTGTTPVSTPGTVADSSNPVGLALDIRAGTTGGIVPVGARVNIDPGWVEGPTGTWTSNDMAYLKFALPSGVFCRVFFTLTSSGITVIDTNSGVGGGTPGTYEAVFKATEVSLFSFGAGAVVNNIRYQEIPGNHLLQATSTARPLESARVNLLTYTEDFGNAAWVKRGFSGPDTGQTDPLGGSTAVLFTENDTEVSPAILGTDVGLSENIQQTYGIFMKATSPTSLNLSTNGLYAGITASLTTSWQFFEVTQAYGTYGPHIGGFFSITRGTGIGIYVWHPQLQIGTTATPYQSIPGNGSTYPSTGFPIYQKYDGTDDGMATASFAAGTLTSDMDCLIAVRRDAAGNAVCGLYESVAEANKVFGIAESGSGSGCVGSGAGTPTVWVDGVQLTGGTAVTRGTLHTALTVGEYHVLEFRGLDLSTWTASGFGLYTSYVLNGAQGGILLFPSSTSAADRDAARTWLGAKVGLTL